MNILNLVRILLNHFRDDNGNGTSFDMLTVSRQVIGIHMGTNCAPLTGGLFCIVTNHYICVE